MTPFTTYFQGVEIRSNLFLSVGCSNSAYKVLIFTFIKVPLSFLDNFDKKCYYRKSVKKHHVTFQIKDLKILNNLFWQNDIFYRFTAQRAIRCQSWKHTWLLHERNICCVCYSMHYESIDMLVLLNGTSDYGIH